jgi:hypothetical protein
MFSSQNTLRLGLRVLLVASAACALPAVAAAQDAAAERAASSQSDYRKAHEAARSKNWIEARRILRGLWAQAKTYDVAASLSEAEFALGHPAAAARYMDYALRHVVPNESAATVANMKSALEKLRPRVGAVKVTIDDPSASLSLDGDAIDYEPETEVFVEPGQHVFEARSGERVSSRAIDAAAGTNQALKLELPAAAASTLASAQAPWLASTPVARDTGPRPRTIALAVGSALAVGGLGTGIGFGLSSNASEREANDYRARIGEAGCRSASTSSDCTSLQESVDSQRRKTLVANVGYGVAAVGLVTLGVALLWPRSKDSVSSRSSSRVELRWSGDAISLGGKF